MKLGAGHLKTLRAALRARSRDDLKRAFSLIRAHDDEALLAALAPARKRAARRKADPLVRELEQTLKPIIGPAREKAELLVQHIARKHRRRLGFAPQGLADAARRLRAKFSDAEISAGARSLVAHLARVRGDRETVV